MIPFPLILPLLRKLPWRLIAYAVLLAGLIAAALWYRHSLIRGGIERGEARIQALWDADEAIESQLAVSQITQNAIDEAAAAARNGELERQHREEVAAALADRDRVAGLYAAYRRAARASGTEETGHQPGTTPAGQDGGIQQADAEAELDQLNADAFAESKANASQLNALIAELVPQMEAANGP